MGSGGEEELSWGALFLFSLHILRRGPSIGDWDREAPNFTLDGDQSSSSWLIKMHRTCSAGLLFPPTTTMGLSSWLKEACELLFPLLHILG